MMLGPLYFYMVGYMIHFFKISKASTIRSFFLRAEKEQAVRL